MTLTAVQPLFIMHGYWIALDHSSLIIWLVFTGSLMIQNIGLTDLVHREIHKSNQVLEIDKGDIPRDGSY